MTRTLEPGECWGVCDRCGDVPLERPTAATQWVKLHAVPVKETPWGRLCDPCNPAIVAPRIVPAKLCTTHGQSAVYPAAKHPNRKRAA